MRHKVISTIWRWRAVPTITEASGKCEWSSFVAVEFKEGISVCFLGESNGFHPWGDFKSMHGGKKRGKKSCSSTHSPLWAPATKNRDNTVNAWAGLKHWLCDSGASAWAGPRQCEDGILLDRQTSAFCPCPGGFLWTLYANNPVWLSTRLKSRHQVRLTFFTADKWIFSTKLFPCTTIFCSVAHRHSRTLEFRNNLTLLRITYKSSIREDFRSVILSSSSCCVSLKIEGFSRILGPSRQH